MPLILTTTSTLSHVRCDTVLLEDHTPLILLQTLLIIPLPAGEIKDGQLRIGNTMVDVYNTETKMKVPDVLFYENPQVRI